MQKNEIYYNNNQQNKFIMVQIAEIFRVSAHVALGVIKSRPLLTGRNIEAVK